MKDIENLNSYPNKYWLIKNLINKVGIHNLKILNAILSIILVFFTSCGQLNSNLNQKSNTVIDSATVFKSNVSPFPKDTLISIIGVGDLMLGTNYPNSGLLPPDDGKYLLDSAKDLLAAADLTFGNLEGTLLNTGGKPKRCNTPDHCVSFRMPEHYAEYLNEAGFDVLSLANNHSNDMGEEGRISTKETLEKYSIKYAGHLLTSPADETEEPK